MKPAEADMLRLCYSLIKKEDWTKAWAATNVVLNEYPDSPQALYLLGVILRQDGHIGLALPIFGKALAHDQKQPNLWMNYGACLHDLHLYENAIEAFNVVRAMLPDDPMPIANVAASLVQMGKWHDCINNADIALKMDPSHEIANISAGFAKLALGRWKDAWKHAEHMYGASLVIRVYNDREHEEPMWDGTKGQKVVVQCDQGLGDIIMFSQMIPQLQADCREVIIECAERMKGYFIRNFPGVTVHPTLKEATHNWNVDNDIDAHIHISFLGRFYRNKDSDFPRKAYVTPDPELLAKWQEWLNLFPKPWRGIAWRGGIQRTQKHERSIDLEEMKPIISIPGTNFDICYHDTNKEIERSGFNIVDPNLDLSNYDDTIAFIAALDEVYTVTTTVAHVCGAMGKKAKVLVPAVPTWRYAYRMEDGGMIWYPKGSVDLVRVKPGETGWESAIKRAIK